MKASSNKLCLGQVKLPFLGFVIFKSELTTDPEMLSAII